tara:strand:- start:81 stop:452 length:372 start_codon:yes stop_codon:yes gene_type:complete
MNTYERIYNILTEAITDKDHPLGDEVKYGRLGYRIGKAAMAKPGKKGALKGTPEQKAERVAKFARKLSDRAGDKRGYARQGGRLGSIGIDFERGVDAATRGEPGKGTTGAQNQFRSTLRKKLN